MHNYLYYLRIRVKLILALILLLAILLTTYFAILMLSSTNKLNANLVIMNRTPNSLNELIEQADKLQQITSNIDSHTLNEIKTNIIDIANIANLVGIESQAQYKSWLVVKGEINKDTDSFIQLKQKLDQVQKLQDSEVVRLKTLLDESTKPSLLSISISMLASFTVGVLSSVLASHIYSRWIQRKLRTHQNKGGAAGGVERSN